VRSCTDTTLSQKNNTTHVGKQKKQNNDVGAKVPHWEQAVSCVDRRNHHVVPALANEQLEKGREGIK